MVTVNIGDLVQKRWGRIDPHQQGTLGLVIATDGPDDRYIVVSYQNKVASLKKGLMYRADEFELVSAGLVNEFKVINESR